MGLDILTSVPRHEKKNRILHMQKRRRTAEADQRGTRLFVENLLVELTFDRIRHLVEITDQLRHFVDFLRVKGRHFVETNSTICRTFTFFFFKSSLKAIFYNSLRPFTK